MKVAVLDANAFWTEQLFRQCGRFADVLLLKPRDFRMHRQLCRTWRSDLKPQGVEHRVWEQYFSMPPGWMFALWPLACRKFQRAIQRFAGSEPLTLVLTYPQYRSLSGAINLATSVYYNLDDYCDNWSGHDANVPRWEAEIVEMADLTICIADYRARMLREQHPSRASRIHHLPLGCTPEFMAESGKQRERSVPEVLQRIPGAKALYIGALNWRFDYEFLAQVAERLPQVNFILGGKLPTSEDGDTKWREGLERTMRRPNVHFIGWIEHACLGDYLNAADFLFMCYSECRFNTNACPAKLWDYLGTGLPVVANAANPETLLCRNVIHIGGTPDEFVTAVGGVLAGERAGLREKRLQIAHAHRWEKLADRLRALLAHD
jgi:glycosyltransferase involved in cell wall biosynthesis